MITLVEVEEFVDERTAARLWRSGEHARLLAGDFAKIERDAFFRSNTESGQ